MRSRPSLAAVVVALLVAVGRPGVVCNPGQQAAAGRAYTRLMFTENNKIQLFAAWTTVVCLVAFAIGAHSVLNWIVVACVGIVPPVVARSFWRVPAQTMSESIRDARK